MARDSVVVDGVTLTRAQAEKALEQLNASDPLRNGCVYLYDATTEGLRVVCDSAQGYVNQHGHVFPVFEPERYHYLGTLIEIVRFYREAKGL